MAGLVPLVCTWQRTGEIQERERQRNNKGCRALGVPPKEYCPSTPSHCTHMIHYFPLNVGLMKFLLHTRHGTYNIVWKCNFLKNQNLQDPSRFVQTLFIPRHVYWSSRCDRQLYLWVLCHQCSKEVGMDNVDGMWHITTFHLGTRGSGSQNCGSGNSDNVGPYLSSKGITSSHASNQHVHV